MSGESLKGDICGMRKTYKDENEVLSKRTLKYKDPFLLFQEWFQIACNTDGIREANAMAVATADRKGRPSLRYVLLKQFDKTGFCFHTNYESRKAKEIIENPYVSLVFYWEPLCRQIRIEGVAEKLSDEESEKYFHSRPRSSQISAIISKQSTVIESRMVLREKQSELEAKFSDLSIEIPKPAHWGGFRIKPEVFEFWQGQTNRLHDRIRFRRLSPGEVIDEKMTLKGDDDWYYERLAP